MNGLKSMRKKAGFSRATFAEIIGISARSLYLYESGRREPRFETLKRLAAYFNCKIDDLL